MGIEIMAIVAAILGVLGVTASAASTSDTNQANKQMNEENNETQIKLARESYEQGTPKNQIAELQKAGYSEQQAKMLVAGGYTPAQQPLATTTPATAMPVLDPSSIMTLLGQVAQPMMSAGVSSYGDPNGGFFGSIVADPVLNVISDHLHELNIGDICTPANFAKFAAGADAPEWAKELVSSEDWKKLSKSLLAQRAYNSWMRDNNAFYTWEQQFDQQEIQTDLLAGQQIIQDLDISLKHISEQQEQIRTGVLSEQLVQEHWNTKMKELGFSEADLNLKSHRFLYSLQNEAEVKRLKAQMAVDDRERQLWTSGAKEMYIKRVIKEEGLKCALAQYQQAQLNDQMWLFQTSPDFRAAHSTLTGLDAMHIHDQDLYRELYMQLSPEIREQIDSESFDESSAIFQANENVWLISRGKQISGFAGSFKDWLFPSTPSSSTTRTTTMTPNGVTRTITERSYGD